jgi:hypothetical protein
MIINSHCLSRARSASRARPHHGPQGRAREPEGAEGDLSELGLSGGQRGTINRGHPDPRLL